jgi:hypothetical protein
MVTTAQLILLMAFLFQFMLHSLIPTMMCIFPSTLNQAHALLMDVVVVLRMKYSLNVATLTVTIALTTILARAPTSF